MKINKISGAVTANLAVLAMAGTVEKVSAKTPGKPNVVFILIDDMGWRDLGCFGSDFYETPNIDRMAQDGIRFTSAYSSCHVSSPSRASILTGMYPASLGLTDWLPGRREYPFQRLSTTEVVQDLPSEAETIAETMRANGYHTALIGKWHLGETGSVPQEHGFDIHIPDGYLRGWPNTYYAPFGMNGYDGEEGDYLTDKMTDEAVNYIEQNQNEPFFLLLSHFAVHDPVEGRPDLVAKYTEKLKKMPVSKLAPYILEGNPDDPDALSPAEIRKLMDDPVYAQHRILPHNLVKVKQIQDNVNFAAMVESVDQSVGRIVSTLDSLGLSENTVLIFYSDNGGMSAANYGNPNRVIPSDRTDEAYSTSVAPLRGGKGWLYEGGLRVPMIVKWPGKIKKGSVSDFPVTGPDFYKTIVSMTGAEAPESAGKDGVDLYPAMKGKKMEERPLFWHFPHYSNHGMLSPSGAVRFGDYKLIEYYENGTVQLFNIAEDECETEDIAAEHPEIVSRLKSMLAQWRKDVGADMPAENLSYDPLVAGERYRMAAPPKFFPCRISSLAETSCDVNKLLAVACTADSLVGARAVLDAGLSAMDSYYATGSDAFFKSATDARKQAEAQKPVIKDNPDLTFRWNLLSARLFSMNGNGRYAGSFIPTGDASGKEYSLAYYALLSRNLAGDLNNNLLIVPLCDFTIAPGIKFGGGSISVHPASGGITVSLDEYEVPHVYQSYSIEIFVRNKSLVRDVLLNGKPVSWKYNNRGFVSVHSLWHQGDVISVLIEDRR